MELRVDRDITGEVFRPTLLAAWPAMGSVGVGAIDYLRRTLEAEPFAEVDAGEFFTPEAVVVEEGLARTFSDLPSHVFYFVLDPALILFEGEAQIWGEGGVTLLNRILDFSEHLGVQRIYTAAAQALSISHREQTRVFGAANQRSLRDDMKDSGVEILKEGQISGMNGLMLGFAGLRDIEAACLMATMPLYAQMMPNPKASRAIIRTFEDLFGLKVDMAEIDDAVEQMNGTMAEIEDKIRETFVSMESHEGDEEDLGEVDEETVPQVVMEKIERLFEEVQKEGSREKATQLKQELDRWNLYGLYEDRFLSLFRHGRDTGV